MRKAVMGVALVSALAAGLVLAQGRIALFVNGKPASRPVLVVGGERYVSLSALRAAGAEVKEAAARIDLNFSAPARATQSAGAQGTSQLAGADGKLNQAYTVGRRNPLNFTLRGAELSVSNTAIGPIGFTTSSAQKLLIVRFTVQNPLKTDVDFNTSSYQFTVVDGRNVNVTPEPFGNDFIAREGTTEALRVTLKPAQRVDAYAVFVVSAQGTLPKLIVQRTGEDSASVVRYDLRPLLKGLSAPFATPNDPTTALEEVKGQPGTFYPTLNLDLRFDGAQFSSEAVNDQRLDEGKRWLWVAFTARNPYPKTSGKGVGFGECSLSLTLVDAGDERTNTQRCGTNPYRATRAERLPGGELRPGDEVRFRYLFQVPSDVSAKTISIRGEDTGRVYSFDLGAVR